MYLTVLNLKYTKYEHQVQVLLNFKTKVQIQVQVHKILVFKSTSTNTYLTPALNTIINNTTFNYITEEVFGDIMVLATPPPRPPVDP